MAILQVKGMNNQLYEALKRRAELENRSISQEVISIITQHLGRKENDQMKVTAEFLKLSGSWKTKESAKAVVSGLRKSRKRSRKDKGISHVFD